MRAVLALWLLALGGAALWLAVRAPLAPPPPAAPGPESGAATAQAAPFSPAAPPAANLSALRERPLFSAARRPPPPAPAPVAPAPSGLLFDRYTVAGVVVTDGAAVAMLRDAQGGALLRLRVGQRLGAAELVAIDLARLTFRVGAATVVAPVRSEDRGE